MLAKLREKFDGRNPEESCGAVRMTVGETLARHVEEAREARAALEEFEAYCAEHRREGASGG